MLHPPHERRPVNRADRFAEDLSFFETEPVTSQGSSEQADCDTTPREHRPRASTAEACGLLRTQPVVAWLCGAECERAKPPKASDGWNGEWKCLAASFLWVRSSSSQSERLCLRIRPR